MKCPFRRLATVCGFAAGLAYAASAAPASGAEVKFDVNDISFLWPVPESVQDVDGLIAADETVGEGGTVLWPKEVFEKVMATAQTVEVTGSAGPPVRITFNEDHKAAFENAHTWKVVAVRVDASAPGSHDLVVQRFGSRPQIRLVVQPVTIEGNKFRVHDVTAHLVFDFVLPPSPDAPLRGVPDQERFRRILDDLKEIKSGLAAAGVQTAGVKLGVHPGFRADRQAFTEKLRAFLKKHVGDGRITTLSFMGIERPEPWIFFAMKKEGDEFFRASPPPLGGAQAQMLSFAGSGDPEIVPRPKTTTFGPAEGVSTTPLFEPGAAQRLGDLVFPADASEAARDVKLGDVPDIVANPFRANVFNTDCVSCHTESSRRILLNVPPAAGNLRFATPAGISGIDETLLPRGSKPDDPLKRLNIEWNVRNFGWFPPFPPIPAKPALATVTIRTANEAAESVDFINRTYLGQQPAGPGGERQPAAPEPAESDQDTVQVSNALTLVLTIKGQDDFRKLKALVERMQGLPPDQNPIRVALTKLRNVHFARFVFLGEDKLLVITTYDGPFDAYIDAFTDEIGPVFDKLLVHVKDAPPLPVGQNLENREAFLEYVRKHDLGGVGPFFSAYPNLSVQDILRMEKQTTAPAAD